MSFQIQKHLEVVQVETRQDTSLGIMRWGANNSFPQTLLNLIEQSPSAKPAVTRTAKFYKGAGFNGEDEVVNSYGMTLKEIISAMADDYAGFEGFALQCDYNIKGEVIGINPLGLAELRFNEFDELNYASKIGYHPDFARNSEVRKTVSNTVTKEKIKWFNRFNPKSALAQIDKVKGVGNYLGQVLYFSERGHSAYPVPPLQAPINYLLSDIENSILVRKETATGFINSYILKTTLSEADPNLIAFESAIAEAQGARGTGKVVTFSGLSEEDMKSTILEELGGGNTKAIIESSELTYKLAREVITGAYLIPPALVGMEQASGFSGADLKEAYFVFNSITQGGRDTIEREINKILKHSIFDTKKVEIKKLKLNLEDEDEVEQIEGGGDV